MIVVIFILIVKNRVLFVHCAIAVFIQAAWVCPNDCTRESTQQLGFAKTVRYAAARRTYHSNW